VILFLVGASEKNLLDRQRSMSVKSYSSDIQNVASAHEAETKKVYGKIYKLIIVIKYSLVFSFTLQWLTAVYVNAVQ